MKSDAEKAQEILVKNYSIAPDLLTYKLYQIFRVLDTPEKVAVFNDTMQDIHYIIGDSIEPLLIEMTRLIVETGKSDMRNKAGLPEEKQE